MTRRIAIPAYREELLDAVPEHVAQILRRRTVSSAHEATWLCDRLEATRHPEALTVATVMRRRLVDTESEGHGPIRPRTSWTTWRRRATFGLTAATVIAFVAFSIWLNVFVRDDVDSEPTRHRTTTQRDPCDHITAGDDFTADYCASR